MTISDGVGQDADYPVEWQILTTQDAAANASNAIVGGPFGSDLVSADYVVSGIPVIRGQNMSGKFVDGEFVFVSQKKAKALVANLARSGDLIFTQRGTLGQVAIVPHEPYKNYVISQSQMKLTLDRMRHEPAYLYQYFNSNAGQKQILLSAIQTGVPHTNLGILRGYTFPAPPLEEQRAIATALSDVDALLAGLERLLGKKRDIKQAAMQQLLTGQNRLPGFSGGWETKRLGDICEISMGRTPPRLNSAMWGIGHIWLSIADLHGKIVVRSKEQITDLAASTMAFVPEGTLLMSFKLSIGRLCFAGCDLYTNEAICAFKKLEANSDYLYYALGRTDFSLYGKQAVKGYTLNKQSLALIEVSLPPRHEQDAIATVLSDMDIELAAIESRLAKTRAIKQGMMQELLTGRTRLI